MALLITGAMGHVGLTLTELAVNSGLDVVAQYRNTFDHAAAARIGPKATWISCDLADGFGTAAAIAGQVIDGCIHTAAVPNDRLARPDPWHTIQTNIGATACLLELARRQQWRRFIYVSTGSVFQREHSFSDPILEDHRTAATSVYGTTKHAGEGLTTMYRGEYGLSAASVRISFVYGPPLVPRRRDLPRGPLVTFLHEAILGQAVREATGGAFEASFTHVADVATGLLAAYQAPTLRHDIYHLGNGRNWTTWEVAEAIRAAVPGAVVEVGSGTMPWTTYNTMRGPLAGTRLHEDTGFSPAYPLRLGVAAFADWMRANPERLGDPGAERTQ